MTFMNNDSLTLENEDALLRQGRPEAQTRERPSK
jgi:hypothetical protein